MEIIVLGKGPRDSVGSSNTEIPASVAQCMKKASLSTDTSVPENAMAGLR